MKNIFKNKAVYKIAGTLGIAASVSGCTIDTSKGSVVNRSDAIITTPKRDYASEIQKSGVSPITLYQQVSRQSGGPNFDIKPKIVRSDPGGGVKERINEIADIISTGQIVMIEGGCYSSCAMLLTLDKYDQLCVGKGTTFGFHAPFSWGERLSDADRKQWVDVIAFHYPEKIKTRYFEVGSQHVWSIDTLSGDEVRKMGNIPSCDSPKFASLR